MDGREWRVVKVRPDGSVATSYSAVEIPSPEEWIAVEAPWVHGHVDIIHFAFQPGDVLREYFALNRPLNAFATFRASGEFVAWYCNVTHPTAVSESEIVWHDLFVDVVVLPDGTVFVLDEDELEQSGIANTDPELQAMILNARDELLALIETHAYPFSEICTAESAAQRRAGSRDPRGGGTS